jgi:anti-anti-sigma regulatory factor
LSVAGPLLGTLYAGDVPSSAVCPGGARPAADHSKRTMPTSAGYRRLLSGHAFASCPHTTGKRLAMQTREIFLPARFLASRSASARPRSAARSWDEAGPASAQVVCLRLAGQLCAGTGDALVEAVCARVRAAMPAACAVVLDLSAIPAIDAGARAALLSLCGLLSDSHARLRLVVPRAEVRAALSGDGTADAIGLDALHPSNRAAILAAHAALPGPALVTPAMRALLTQPPELLRLAG